MHSALESYEQRLIVRRVNQQAPISSKNNARKNAQRASANSARIEGGNLPLAVRSSTLRFGMLLTPFPARLVTKMSYTDLVGTAADGTTSSTTGSALGFGLNDIFLPRASGHQPYGFDTFATMYASFRVYRCKVEVSALNRTAGNTVYGFVAFRPSGNTSSPGATALAYSVIPERPFNTMFRLVGSAARAEENFNIEVDLPKIEGLTKAEYCGNPNYAGTTAASPAGIIYMQIANSSDSVSGAIDWKVDLTYEVEFFNRKTLSQS